MRTVDQSAIRVNQGFIVALTIVAFLLSPGLGGEWIALGVAVALALGTALPHAAPFMELYRRVLRPVGLVKPRVVPDDPMPHRFAQGVGSGFLFAAYGFLAGNLTVVGWTLLWVVAVLAAVNLAFNFCAGCFVYYQLDRRGILPRAIASSRSG